MSRTSVLPEGLTLVGDIEGPGDLVVAGRIEGAVEVDGSLTLEPGAAIVGDIKAFSIVVRGRLEGDARAGQSIRIESSAVVIGEAQAPKVNVVEGAKIRGRVRMDAPPRPEPRPAPEASAPERSGPPREGAPEPDPGTAAEPRRRRRRRAKKKPPPPNIPSVGRRRARRKDRDAPSPQTS